MRKISSPEYGRSEEALVAAVIALLDERDASEIAITQVVERAGVSRPTFYAAFPELSAALEAAAMRRLEDAFAGIHFDGVNAQDWSEAMGEAFYKIVSALVPHQWFFRRVLRSAASSGCHQRMVAFVADRLRTVSPVSGPLTHGPMPIGVSSTAVAAGSVWLITDWLLHNDSPSTREVHAAADQARDFVLMSVVGGLGADAPRADPATAR